MSASPALRLVQEAIDEPRKDIYLLLDELHQYGTHAVTEWGGTWVWGYHEVLGLLRSPGFGKGGKHGSAVLLNLTAEQEEQLRRAGPEIPAYLNRLDNPEHSRLRRLVSHAYVPRMVETLRDVIAQNTVSLLASLPRDEPVDLMKALAEPLPAQVIGELIGLPEHDRAGFAEKALTQALDLDPSATFEYKLYAARMRGEIFEYVRQLIDERRSDLRDDLVSNLIRLQMSDSGLTLPELVSLVMIMYLAGFQTTTHMIGNGLVALLSHQAEYRKLTDDPALAKAATEEILRYDAPVMTIGYFALQAGHAAGEPVDKGTGHTMLLGAANRDPRVFGSPGTFDIRRVDPAPLVSFGNGPHFCLGASLARLEGELVFGQMAQRFPDARLTGPVPQRGETFRFRTFDHVYVTLGEDRLIPSA